MSNLIGTPAAVSDLRRTLRALERSLARGFGEGGACCGITVAQCHALLELGREGIAMGRVAEALGLDPSTATRLVDELVKAGFAERLASSTDRRAVLVRRSAEGERKAASIDAAWNGYFELALGTMRPESRAALETVLPEFLEALRSTGGSRGEGACECRDR
ncbi:MAG: MarR family transcriptional regulator [Spirochaetia bacterium]|nr:MarR family transcriptional regulator [Spirochaetia bacterium]